MCKTWLTATNTMFCEVVVVCVTASNLVFGSDAKMCSKGKFDRKTDRTIYTSYFFILCAITFYFENSEVELKSVQQSILDEKSNLTLTMSGDLTVVWFLLTSSTVQCRSTTHKGKC